jgi:hypothetical protein
MTESVMKMWYHDPEVKEMCGKLAASMVERVKLRGSHSLLTTLLNK